MSYIHISADLPEAKFGQVWRTDDGTVYATVRMGGATLRFTSAADARAAARACEQAADAHDKLTADSNSDREEMR